MNKVLLLGRLTKDPEIRYTQSAQPLCVARYTLAVDKGRFKKEGEPDADFIFCVSFGKLAEIFERYVKKGKQIAVCGRLTVRNFEDSTGQKRWATEVIVDEMTFADSKGASDAQMASQNAGAMTPPSYEPEGFTAITQSIDDDDLPF